VLDHQRQIDSQPDWVAASDELARQLQQLNDLDARVELLDTLCVHLGPDLYPAFLQLLFFTENNKNTETQKQLTDTLAYAMSTGRLPCGNLPAWGSTNTASPIPYNTSRALGPIEFLCAWYAQPTNLPQLNDATFDKALSALLRLINSNRATRKMYCYNLNMYSIDHSIGTFSSATRNAMAKLAQAWNTNDCSDKLAAQFIANIKSAHTVTARPGLSAVH